MQIYRDACRPYEPKLIFTLYDPVTLHFDLLVPKSIAEADGAKFGGLFDVE